MHILELSVTYSIRQTSRYKNDMTSFLETNVYLTKITTNTPTNIFYFKALTVHKKSRFSKTYKIKKHNIIY